MIDDLLTDYMQEDGPAMAFFNYRFNMGDSFATYMEITSSGLTSQIAIERFRMKIQEYLERLPDYKRILWRVRPEEDEFILDHDRGLKLWRCYGRLVLLPLNSEILPPDAE